MTSRNGSETENEILTAREVAEMLKVSVGWVMSHASGKYKPVIPSYKLGGALRFRSREVEEFLSRCRRAIALGIPIQ